MQLQRPMTLGYNAGANDQEPSYNQLLANCLAEAAILQHEIVIYDTSVTANVGLLGHSVNVTTTADSAVVAGIAQHDAAQFEPVLICVSGVSYVYVTATITTAGEAIATSATSGSAADATDAAGAYAAELPPAVAGVSLEARSATITGKALCKITCG